MFCLNLLPYVGPGWYPKVLLAAMLDLGVCRWDHIVLGISARSHVEAATLRRALERMDAAWPETQRERDDRPVGAQRGGGLQRAQQQQQAGRRGRGLLSGLRLRGGHGVGLRLRQRLLSNGTYRPIHDAVLGFEHCMVAKARRILDAPPRYLAQVKTDCLLTQRLPHGAAAGAGGAAPPGRHAGLPCGRDEAVAQRPGATHGGGAAQTTEVERGGRPYKPLPGGQLPAAHGPAGHRKDGPGPDHCGEAARAGRGGAPGVQDALLRDGQPLGAQVRVRGQRAKAGLAGGGGDHAAGHGALGGPAWG